MSLTHIPGPLLDMPSDGIQDEAEDVSLATAIEELSLYREHRVYGYAVSAVTRIHATEGGRVALRKAVEIAELFEEVCLRENLDGFASFL